MFDYNLDHFELGTLDDPQWKMADRPASYVLRAAAARGGLWGNHGYEAAYAMTYKDGDGQALSGAHRYTLRFAEPPPVDAFWSITMYDLPEFFLVANPIDRYSVGDRTPGCATTLTARSRSSCSTTNRGWERARELAADAGRRVPPDPAAVPAERRHLRRQL